MHASCTLPIWKVTMTDSGTRVSGANQTAAGPIAGSSRRAMPMIAMTTMARLRTYHAVRAAPKSGVSQASARSTMRNVGVYSYWSIVNGPSLLGTREPGAGPCDEFRSGPQIFGVASTSRAAAQ